MKLFLSSAFPFQQPTDMIENLLATLARCFRLLFYTNVTRITAQKILIMLRVRFACFYLASCFLLLSPLFLIWSILCTLHHYYSNKSSTLLGSPLLAGHKKMILAKMPFNSENFQIFSKVYLKEIGHSVLKLQETTSRKLSQGTPKKA